MSSGGHPEPVTTQLAGAERIEGELPGAVSNLYRRWRIAGRGKLPQKIVVARARELAGFVWAIATDQALRSA
jgi:hypothetical protein